MELQNNYPLNYTASHFKGRNIRENSFLFSRTRPAAKSIQFQTCFSLFPWCQNGRRVEASALLSIIKISNGLSCTPMSLCSFKVRCLRTRESLLLLLTEAKRNYLTLYFTVPRVRQYHHHHHLISSMELGHLLTRSGLTYPEVSSGVYHYSFCQLGSSVSLPWGVRCSDA